MKIIRTVVGCLIPIIMIVVSRFVDKQLSIVLVATGLVVIFLLKVVIIPFSLR